MRFIKLLIVSVLSLFVFSAMANSSPPQEQKQYNQHTVSCDTVSVILELDNTETDFAPTVDGNYRTVTTDARINPVSVLGYDTLHVSVYNDTLHNNYLSQYLSAEPLDLLIRDGDNDKNTLAS